MNEIKLIFVNWTTWGWLKFFNIVFVCGTAISYVLFILATITECVGIFAYQEAFRWQIFAVLAGVLTYSVLCYFGHIFFQKRYYRTRYKKN